MVRGNDDRGAALVLGGRGVGGVNLAYVVAAPVQQFQIGVAPAVDQGLEFRRIEELLAQFLAAEGRVPLRLTVYEQLEPFDDLAVVILARAVRPTCCPRRP